jgi:hypothetical protein
MATRDRLIVEAVLAALREAQIAAVEDRVYEDRGFAVAAQDMPAIDVMVDDISDELRDFHDEQLAHRMRVQVAVMARERLGESPSSIAAPIAAAAHRAVFGSAELAAVAAAVEPAGTTMQRQATGDGVVLRRSQTYLIDFATLFDDLEAAP